MANLDLLMRSLEFIEEHLEDAVAVQTEDIAAACFASKSALEKVFCTRVFTSRSSKKLNVCEKSIYENESLEAVIEKIYSEVI